MKNFQLKINWLLQAGKLPMTRGTVSHVRVSHDDDCAVFRTAGFKCDCDPDIRYKGKRLATPPIEKLKQIEPSLLKEFFCDTP